MWNKKDLAPPPINSYKAKTLAIDLRAIRTLLDNGIKEFSERNILLTESKLLSRCIYRNKLQFRNDKGFKFTEKTNKILKQLINFDIVKDLQFFLSSVPKKYEKDTYFPTKQMLEFVLVRLQGFAQLLRHLGESAINTGRYMYFRLKLGHIWMIGMITFAIAGRIFTVARHLTSKCCILYNDLLPLHDKLEITGGKWLQDGYVFPLDLLEWLDIDWLKDKPDVFAQVQIDLPIFNLLDDSDDEDVQFCYQYNLNDCIEIKDDSILNNDDDVQLVEITRKNLMQDDSDIEEIELENMKDNSNIEEVDMKNFKIRKNLSKPLQRKNSIEDSYLMIDDSDINDDSSVQIVDEDVGEAISRDIINLSDSEIMEINEENTLINENDFEESDTLINENDFEESVSGDNNVISIKEANTVTNENDFGEPILRNSVSNNAFKKKKKKNKKKKSEISNINAEIKRKENSNISATSSLNQSANISKTTPSKNKKKNKKLKSNIKIENLVKQKPNISAAINFHQESTTSKINSSKNQKKNKKNKNLNAIIKEKPNISTTSSLNRTRNNAIKSKKNKKNKNKTAIINQSSEILMKQQTIIDELKDELKNVNKWKIKPKFKF